MDYLADSNKDSKKWENFKAYIGSISGIKIAKKNKLLNTTLPQRRGKELMSDDIENPESGFLARNLNDTAYVSKFIKNFVEQNLVFSENSEIKQKVKARSGTLTSQLRYNWGIGDKDRNTNLHHAEDAIILAFSTQGEVQRMSTISSRREDFKYQTADERSIKFTPPFADFKGALGKSIANIFVSFAPRRKIAGAAHKATIKPKDTGGKYKFLVNHGAAENGTIQRVDVFIDEKDKYQFVVFYPSDFYKDEFPQLDLSGNKIDENSQFLFSLFKSDLIGFVTKKKHEEQQVYFSFITSDGNIIYQPHNLASCEVPSLDKEGKQKLKKNGKPLTHPLKFKTTTLIALKKYQVSMLGGNPQEITNEKRLPLIKQMRKNKFQKQK